MPSRRTTRTVLISVIVPMLVTAASIALCAAQASYSESFDNVGPVNAGQHGPSNLIAAGWIFRNQSSPAGSGSWSGDSSQPQSGTGSLTVSATVAGAWSASAAASSWAILPAIPNQTNGDVLRFFIRQANVPCCTPQARLEVRYSPGGGTSTGLGVSGVGSFTTVLLDILDVENRPWTEQSVTLPGNGRIAFRFYLPQQASSTDFAGDITIDSLTVGNPVGEQGFYESFDSLSTNSSGGSGPLGLIARGWEFRNQSSPVGFGSYAIFSHATNPILPTAHSGTFYLGVTDATAAAIGDPLSVWAILPAIANQRSGDPITFALYTRLSTSSLEVRYSPTGGVGTGSGVESVGDFTQVLGTLDTSTGSWVQYQFIVPGAGRLAFRYRGQRAAFNSFYDYVGIDTLSVGVPPSLCNLPPNPAAGQTVHWTAAGGPYQICQSMTIVAGATALVDPGTHIDVDAGHGVTLRGTLQMQGTAAAPVTMTAATSFPPMIEVAGGMLQTDFAQLGGWVSPQANGTLLITDTTFNGPGGGIFADLYSGTGFGRLERVTFNNSELTITNYTLLLRDVTLNSSTSRLLNDYPFLSNITADGKPIDVDAAPQGTRLDTITVRNVTSPPGGQNVYTGFGLGLTDGNFLVGPNVTLTNNTFPVRLVSAGILPGSVLPKTGNINNLIYVPGIDHGGASTIWADTGIPYFIAEHYAQHGGSLKILEGASVKLASGVSMSGDPSDVEVYGTEERPVTFEQASSGADWGTLENFYRIRHAVIDGATIGGTWPSDIGWGFMDSSVVQNCSHLGVFDSAIVKKTLFQDNYAAASVLFNQIDLSGDTNPNAFEGNTLGVTVAGNASYNWWGSPTGPTAADNPGGTGDSVDSGVPYLPFRTVRPDFSDAPPIVDLEQHSFLARPGEKFVLTWKARDDRSIVSQRVLMSKDGDIVQGNLVEPVIVLAGSLPGTQRSIEFIMPEPVSRFFGSGNIRIESTDNAGQIGWDDLHIYAEYDEPGQLVLTSPLPTAVTAGADLGPVCWREEDINPIGGMVEAYVLLENSGEYKNISGVTTYLECLSGNLTAPFVSTDRARIVLSLFTGGGVAQPEYYFGPVFSIRPDTRVDDAPPTVAMTSPAPGTSVAGGATLPIRWDASDDDSVRFVHIQVSTDGGRTWNFIARDLPGSSDGYDWRVPPSTGNHDVRIKVIAVDTSFQDSSSGSDLSIEVVPRAPGEASATGQMTARRGAGTSVLVDYAPACAAADHVVYWGTGPIAGALVWTGSACGRGTDGTTSFDPGNPPPGGFSYFVIVGQDAAHEGSYGSSSSGAERPEAIGVGACDRPRAIGGGCTP
jgi:hypothetical protein